ncbi:IclR family transcriptional regulator [uncultured Roseobacter sp.]|uniref:IclR family transcriptional regulator n=1 Tax=uncultured Roseobacter sp. TaxID=114847 RepID=UPI0026370E4B|nr:IclR family transcriptional regulator [uncultured Roseobacter sp.]
MSREVQSSIIQKSVAVINLLAQHRGRLSQTEIAQETGFNKSSTHRILAILMGQGLVEFDERDKTYTTGPLLISWARAAWEKMDLSLVDDQDLRDLMTETGMNVALGVRIEHTATFIRTNIPHPYRLAVKAGGQSELHNTAVGKVFLAHMTAEERDAYFKVADLDKFTETTLTTRRDIEAGLPGIRSKGYAVSDREEFYQVVGIAAPIFDHDGRVLAAISLWIPLRIASLDQLLACVPSLLARTKEISARFGLLTGD